MEQVVIQRRGSYFYAKAYQRLVVIMTVLYAAAGAVFAYAGVELFDSWLAGLVALGFVVLTIATLWAGYLAILWVFAREGRQSVEIGAEGIREKRDGREFQFIPWPGVKEIEIAATVVAGASLRVKGNFSEISISNVDLMVTGPMRVRDMHAALQQTSRLRQLFVEIRAVAPRARITMNRLARRRLKKIGDKWPVTSGQ
ncbi:MAG TPA: hypothetical protein VFQ92_03030 [Blastocatellia bacterium]|nr:hypothetical protein [Blastocatellia bacterium]